MLASFYACCQNGIENPVMSEETTEPGRARTACNQRMRIDKTGGV